MEENTSTSIFKSLDKAVFEKLDSFKSSPNYNIIQDYYNSLEEEQQKVFKLVVLVALMLIPLIFLGALYWQNAGLKADLDLRISLVEKAKEIVGQRNELGKYTPQIVASNPISDQSGMTSRLSNILGTMGVDLSKIQVNNFEPATISSNVVKAEADFAFTNVTTDELVNIFTAMIQREKFRVSSVNIQRNADTNLLIGTFHAIHYSTTSGATSEEE